MRDTVGAGALGLVEETIAAGAAPQAARKWWLGELARRANEQGVDIAALPITPADVARIQALVDEGAINDKLARQVFDGVLAGEGTPDEVVAARGLAVVSDDGALGDGGRPRDRRQPRRRRQDPRRQGRRRRGAHRRGDEGDARPGRRRPRARADPRAAAVVHRQIWADPGDDSVLMFRCPVGAKLHITTSVVGEAGPKSGADPQP